MKKLLSSLFFLQVCLLGGSVYAQTGGDLDALRKKEEQRVDSVIFTSKYIRYTTRSLMKSATQTVPIDTSLNNFQNYSPLYQPSHPTAGLGSLGISYRDLLFTPSPKIGFDAGFHALDRYLLTQEDIKYYRAKSPYTDLYYVNGSLQEQVFKVTHSQNISQTIFLQAIHSSDIIELLDKKTFLSPGLTWSGATGFFKSNELSILTQ